jgi:hypothetical protein
MRRRIAFTLAVTLLAGCIPEGRKTQTSRPRGQSARAPQRPRVVPPLRTVPDELSQAKLRQCLIDLGKTGAHFTPFADREMPGGCAIVGAVRLTDVGVPVSGLGPMKCGVAERFADWAGSAVQNAAAVWLQTTVAKIESFGTYNCRPINNVPGGRLSEHGRANAVDISAFVLADGRRITVKDGWRGDDPAARDFLRAVRKAACRRFDVVISPDGDAQHNDHLHFDMGGNGPYCH